MPENLLILDQDSECRIELSQMLTEAGYRVITCNSLTGAICDILRKTVQVVLLAGNFDNLSAVDLVPIFRQCNDRLRIILIAAESSLPVIRRLRRDGIFYHALRPRTPQDRAEIRQAVECAFRVRGEQTAPSH